MFPLLLLYSPMDYMIPASFVQLCGERQRARGRIVEEVNFETSGHVAHLKMHPEWYKEKVKCFVKEKTILEDKMNE